MVSSVSNSAAQPVNPGGASVVAALNGQIRRDKMQLDDWTTCVSAKTAKGQAEIQRLSGQISAEREQVTRAEASAGPTVAKGVTAAAPASSSADPLYGPLTSSAAIRGDSLDVWA